MKPPIIDEVLASRLPPHRVEGPEAAGRIRGKMRSILGAAAVLPSTGPEFGVPQVGG